MGKYFFKLFLVAVVFASGFVMFSCGVSSGEVADAAGNDNDFICVEKGSDLDIDIPIVAADNIPIIEICPPPFESVYPGEKIPEKKPGKPGESYDNLLQPVSSEYNSTGLLVIKTNIPGVEVSLNNRSVGYSDIGIIGVIPRIYILGLSKEGYKDENLWISVGENKKQIFYVEMEMLEE